MSWWRVVSRSPLESSPARRLEAHRHVSFSRPVQYAPDPNGCLDERIQAAEERSDPTMFRVENRAQFVEGINPYFDADAVARVFEPEDSDRMYMVSSESDSESVDGKTVRKPCILAIVGSDPVRLAFAE